MEVSEVRSWEQGGTKETTCLEADSPYPDELEIAMGGCFITGGNAEGSW